MTQIETLDINAIEKNSPLLSIIESLYKTDDRRFPRATRTHDGDYITTVDLKVQVPDGLNVRLRRIAEGDILKLNLSFESFKPLPSRGVDLGFVVNDLEDSIRFYQLLPAM